MKEIDLVAVYTGARANTRFTQSLKLLRAARCDLSRDRQTLSRKPTMNSCAKPASKTSWNDNANEADEFEKKNVAPLDVPLCNADGSIPFVVGVAGKRLSAQIADSRSLFVPFPWNDRRAQICARIGDGAFDEILARGIGRIGGGRGNSSSKNIRASGTRTSSRLASKGNQSRLDLPAG